MAMWFSRKHGTEFSDVETVFRESFRAKLEDCFMAEFIAVNYNLEIYKK